MKENQASRKLDQSNSAKDVLIALSKAGLNAVPIVGGPLSSLIGDFIPTEMSKRRDEFLLKLNEDLSKLEGQFDEEVLTKSHFISVFLQCFRSAMATERQEKIECYEAIIINTLLEQKPDLDEIQVMTRVVDNLTPLHIKLLKLFEDPRSYLSRNSPEKVQQLENSMMGSISSLISITFPSYNQDLISLVANDLSTMNLTDSIPFNTMMTGSGVLGPRIKPMGKRLIAFISKPRDLD